MKSAPNFDRVARIYRSAEYLALGRQLERMRKHYLPHLMDSRHALLFGDGDGRFLAKLLEKNARVSAVAVDISKDMLDILRRRSDFAARRLQIVQASALTVDIPSDIDLVVTHFFLDCLSQTEVDELTKRVGDALTPSALWVISDFAVPQKRLLRLPARLYIRGLYLAFRVLTGLRVTRLPDSQGSLTRAGFKRIERHEALFGLLYTELWQRQ
jgi:SAM-dependent methyltransferase